ncbi:MAG TPA: hypothetical protein VNN15_00415, partial [Solirubrobacterales bacterium]|nr:hypothetical protein [Solirubrobacterales bacterium]
MGWIANGLSRFGRRLLRPRSWPVRWRLASVSSLLTFAILVLFGGAIGQIATQRIRDDFNNEVESAVQILASEFRIVYNAFGQPQLQRGLSLREFVLLDDASVRFYDVNENPIGRSPHAAPLGPLQNGLSDYRDMRVAAAAISSENGELTGYVQYGRSLDHVDATIDRVWLLIAGGIFGGTLLAIFAGVAIAGRAMRPISSLTATAREIATTGDPSQRMPKPAA